MDEKERPTPKPDLQPHAPQIGEQPRCLGGRFFLLDRIGAGGEAVVVRARDRQFSKDVAIKLLRSRDTDLQQRFTQESEVLREMDHPAIVRVLAHDKDGEDLYTALELIEGSDLGDHLLHGGPRPWRQVVEIGIQIADALEAVHRKGLVHRDVKPANIMLADGGESLRVKLIDFGVVRCTENYRLGARAAQRRPTDVGKALGTPGYLPLEAGLVPADARFDVFSLGATLYELLTGTLPEVPLQPLREACARYDGPDDLDLVLAAALALEPEDRTQSAAELGRALAAVRAAHPEHGIPFVRIDDRYELIGLAGTGAKGDAHLAVHRGTGHDVILKFLRSEAPDDVLRFAREAQLLRTFDHPALPRFFDYAPAAKPPYIAMAHAPGEPAVRFCSPPRLKPAEVAAVGLKLAQVLAVLHARGVLHRDVHANNVLIDARGAVTLLDFGYAELGDEFYNAPAGERRYWTPPEARVKIPDGGIGKLAWSAPEVRAGEGWSDKSDVYSLAHLMFRLLTGKVPDKGADPPTSPLVHASTCPEDLAAATVTALNLNPTERPSAAQFARTLAEVLETDEEALVRALNVRKPVDRPPLRLVTARPDAADWTQHPIPETSSSEPPMPSGILPPAPASTSPRGRAWPWVAGTAALVVMAFGLGLSVRSLSTPGPSIVGGVASPPERSTAQDLAAAGDLAAPPSPIASPSLPVAPRSPSVTSLSSTLDRAPAGTLLASATPLQLPSIEEALRRVSTKLRSCSRLAGGLLVVAFKVADKDDLATVAVDGATTPELDSCVREATADLRFQPPGPRDFTEEYMP